MVDLSDCGPVTPYMDRDLCEIGSGNDIFSDCTKPLAEPMLTYHWSSVAPIIAISYHMMTSSNGNIFRVTGPLCGEFTGPGEFPTQRPVTRSFDVFFDLRLNKRLSKQPWGWWFEAPSWSLWRHRNEVRKHNQFESYISKSLPQVPGANELNTDQQEGHYKSDWYLFVKQRECITMTT